MLNIYYEISQSFFDTSMSNTTLETRSVGVSGV